MLQGANMLLEDLLGDDDADLDPADVALAMPPGMPPRIVQRVLSYCFDRTYQLSPDGFCTIKVNEGGEGWRHRCRGWGA
jgi:hypothetical protein